MIFGVGKHEDDRRVVIGAQEDPAGYALDHSAIADLDIGVLHRPGRDRAGHSLARENLGQPERGEAGMAGGESEDLGVAKDSIERQLQVRLLGQWELSRGDRQLLGLSAEMLTHPHRDL